MQDISGDWEGQSRRNWNNAGQWVYAEKILEWGDRNAQENHFLSV